MRGMIRSLGVVGLALLSVVGLVVTWTAATVVQLTATALIMGGTDHPLSCRRRRPRLHQPVPGQRRHAVHQPGGGRADTPRHGADRRGGPERGQRNDVYAVTYPAEFFPVFGSQTFDSSVDAGRGNLNGCVRGTSCAFNGRAAIPDPPAYRFRLPRPRTISSVFGYSQSAVVASLVKKDLIANRPADTDVSFFLLANPMRPNGGVLARGPEGLTIPITRGSPSTARPRRTVATAGDCYETVDVAAQYDGLGGDAPASITNLLGRRERRARVTTTSTATFRTRSFDDALYQGSQGDTDYYIVPARRLPILMPFESFVPSPILTLFEAPLKAAIEAGYARDVNPGVATKVGLLPFRNPVQAIVNIIKAIPVGIDDAIAEATGDEDNRPLGTDPVTSPFGVGGPELPDPPSAGDANLMFSSRKGEDPATHEEISGEVIPEEGTIEENLGNSEEGIAAGDVIEGDVIEQEVTEGEGTEKFEVTTPRIGTKPLARLGKLRDALDSIRLPKIRNPIRFGPQRDAKPPSAAQPGDGVNQTTTSEPDSTPSEPAA